MFTNIALKMSKFGLVYTTIYPSNKPDVIVPITGTSNRYTNLSIPVGVSSNMMQNVGTASSSTSSTGWSIWTEYFDEEDQVFQNAPSTYYSPTLANCYYDDDLNLHILLTYSNTTSSDISIRCVSLLQSIATWSSPTASGSPNNYPIPYIYKNLNDPFIVQANDAIIIDITLSSGDISSVSVG